MIFVPAMYGRIQPALSTNVQPVISDVWGTVVFYLDGRIRELLAGGNSTWNLDFFNRAQNPNITSLNSTNNTAYLRIRVYTNGSYVLNFSNGIVESYLTESNWNKFYFNKKPDYARQIVVRQLNPNGYTQIEFLNGTVRWVYPPLTPQNSTEYQRKIAIL